MVENIEKNILSMLTSPTHKVSSQDLRNNLKKMGRQISFINLSETDKVGYILQFADPKIFDYQEELEVNKKFRNMTYQEWKGKMIAKFDKGLTKKEFLRSFQKKDELCF
ncbi:hypothetical protein NGRA_2470 [Nosema granulosis]|uniref:Uncharacterized protein n=1 Tax=Nosema granulosis TaxID=83296 RepID=A0A9P6KXP0_9MICR|nr:hypothetical protein NGRA_2470 [Nosema granulosis]